MKISKKENGALGRLPVLQFGDSVGVFRCLFAGECLLLENKGSFHYILINLVAFCSI